MSETLIGKVSIKNDATSGEWRESIISRFFFDRDQVTAVSPQLLFRAAQFSDILRASEVGRSDVPVRMENRSRGRERASTTM